MIVFLFLHIMATARLTFPIIVFLVLIIDVHIIPSIFFHYIP